MNSLSLLHLARNVGRAGWGLISVCAALVVHAGPPSGIKLSGHAKGAKAIEALGEHLPDVAKAYGLEAEGLVTLLQTQPSLGVDISGALLFGCAGVAVDLARAGESVSSGGMTADSSVTQIASGTAVDAFKLHSLPGCTRVIYLDFTGHTTTGTIWNSSWSNGAPIVSAPFDQDGDPTTFSDSERATIQGIWKRVAEDYAPFAVDVTTEDPGIEGLRKTSSSDNAYGIRVVISPTSFMGSWGGYAYIGSFTWDSDTPSFTFTSNLANAEKYIAENVSHEVGHTLGLNHDGDASGEYSYGHGSWAPIMGCAFYATISQFSKGEYAGATNSEDDIAIISSYVPLLVDDHGNTLASATVLSGPNVSSGGTIERRTDIDVFRFDTDAGPIVLNIQSPVGEPDLNAKAELLNSAGQVLQTAESISGSIAFNPTLSAGTYYLRISSVGSGDPVNTGFSNYGSLGNYVITGTLIGIAGKQSPTARVTATPVSGTVPLTVSFTGGNSTDPDGTIVGYYWDFGNGASSTAVNPSYTYTAAGTFIAVLTVTDNDGMANSASVAISVAAPANVPPTAVASASTTSGTAPLAITFSSTGSSDPDGTIASYRWNFGDGTSSTSASASKSYSAPGNYTATLTVTDNAGATASSSVAVSVAADPNTAIDVRQFTLSKTTANSGTAAVGTVVVRDRAGRPVSGATINIQWSGLLSAKSTGKTDANGQVQLTSGRTKKSGTITGTITTVTPPAGMVYDPSIDTVTPTTASIAVN